MTLKTVIEALVFGSPKPIQVKEILEALAAAGTPEASEEIRALVTTKDDEVQDALIALSREHIEAGLGFRLVEQVNGWTFVTNPEAAPWVKQLYPEAKPTRLSGPALETLAIIAYRQPVTRADVEAVRGVAVDGVMQVLLDRSLVKITGRADVPGRPLLYGTTEYFLQHFGLRTTEELPNADELKRVPLPTAPMPEEPAASTEPAPKKKRGAKAAAAPADAPPTPVAEAPAGPEEPTEATPTSDAPRPAAEETTEPTEATEAPSQPADDAPTTEALDTPPDSEPKSE